MAIANTPFLRNLLLIDATTSLGAGVVMAAGASFLAPLLALPSGLLFWAGLALFPFAAMLVVLARRAGVSRIALIDIAAINVLWVAASFGINYQFAQRSFRLWLIDGGYHTAQFLLFGVIFGLWG